MLAELRRAARSEAEPEVEPEAEPEADEREPSCRTATSKGCTRPCEARESKRVPFPFNTPSRPGALTARGHLRALSGSRGGAVRRVRRGRRGPAIHRGG